METTISVNEVKKELYKSKAMAKLSHYTSGNLYYNVGLEDGIYQFPISTVETKTEFFGGLTTEGYAVEMLSLSSDLGTTSFEAEMKGSDLNRWISKAIDKGEFIKIG